jgi:hypothetical protein
MMYACAASETVLSVRLDRSESNRKIFHNSSASTIRHAMRGRRRYCRRFLHGPRSVRDVHRFADLQQFICVGEAVARSDPVGHGTRHPSDSLSSFSIDLIVNIHPSLLHPKSLRRINRLLRNPRVTPIIPLKQIPPASVSSLVLVLIHAQPLRTALPHLAHIAHLLVVCHEAVAVVFGLKEARH